MDKGGRYQHAGAEVPANEQRVVRDGQLGKASYDQGKRAGERGEDEDDEEGADVQREVVLSVFVIGATCGSFALGLSSLELALEEGDGQVGESSSDWERRD
jgi:hypothetical protein